MEHDKWRRLGRFWAGAFCAALWAWLALSLTSRIALLSLRFPGQSWLGVLYEFVSFISIFYGAGVIAMFFWHAVISVKKSTNWGVWVVLITLLPVFVIDKLSVVFVICLFPFALLSFMFGADWSREFWQHQRWRHLFGLTSEWEREENQR